MPIKSSWIRWNVVSIGATTLSLLVASRCRRWHPLSPTRKRSILYGPVFIHSNVCRKFGVFVSKKIKWSLLFACKVLSIRFSVFWVNKHDVRAFFFSLFGLLNRSNSLDASCSSGFSFSLLCFRWQVWY